MKKCTWLVGDCAVPATIMFPDSNPFNLNYRFVLINAQKIFFWAISFKDSGFFLNAKPSVHLFVYYRKQTFKIPDFKIV